MIWIKLLVHGDSSISSLLLATHSAFTNVIYDISVPKKELRGIGPYRHREDN